MSVSVGRKWFFIMRILCSKAGLVSIALGALVVGLLHYVVFRNPEALYINKYLHFNDFLPKLSYIVPRESNLITGAMPTAIHVFSFSILTAMSLPFTKGNIISACILWLVVNTGFEAIQIINSCPSIIQADNLLSNLLCAYITNGIFDWLDIASAILGAISAYILLQSHLPPNTYRE